MAPDDRPCRRSRGFPQAAENTHSTFNSSPILPTPRRISKLVKKKKKKVLCFVSLCGLNSRHSLLAIGFLPHVGKKCKSIKQDFFVFLRKNKEISKMKLEGKKVKEVKPGEDTISLYKKSSVYGKFPIVAFTSEWIINPLIGKENLLTRREI